MPTSELIASFNPWDNSVVAEFPVASSADIEGALTSARAALPGWEADAASRRNAVLKLADVIKSRRAEIADLISRETGKVRWEAELEADAMAAKCGISIRAQEQRRTPSSSAGPVGGTLSTTYRPHGVAVVLGPFNFPGHLPLGHIVPALLAGNAVLFKPSEKTPAVGDRLNSLLCEAGIPEDVFHVLQGGPTVATRLLDSDIDAVFFTGAYSTGTRILERFTRRPGVLLALELGGNNPLVSWDVKNVDAAVLNILQSAYATAGQRCSCARRLIVYRNDPVVGHLVQAIQRLKIGQPSDPHAFYGPLISNEAAQSVLMAQDGLIARGAVPLVQAQADPRCPALLTPGLLDVTNVNKHVNTEEHEIFGPLLQLHFAGSFDEAITVANDTAFGLSAGLLSDDATRWEPFRRRIRAGVLTLNRPTTGASSELPFGGVKNSGNHRPSAFFAADYCSYAVAEMATPALVLPDKLPPGVVL